MQRIAAYGLARADGNVLLTLLGRGPHAGTWTLPGGGVDFGERPVDALRRELWEETGLRLHAAELLDADAELMRFDRAGESVESHAVRLLYRVALGDGTPRVLEVGGSTTEVRWVPAADLADLALNPFTARVLATGRLEADQSPTEG